MEWLNDVLGLETTRLNTYQMSARAVVIFFTALIYMRIAGLRTIGDFSVFDRLTLLITGGMLGRTVIIGDEPFFSVLIAGLVIIVLHRIIAWLTFKSSKMGSVFKGNAIMLIKDGVPIEKNMAKEQITTNDVEEALRSNGLTEVSSIKEAWLERSGEISIIKK